MGAEARFRDIFGLLCMLVDATLSGALDGDSPLQRAQLSQRRALATHVRDNATSPIPL